MRKLLLGNFKMNMTKSDIEKYLKGLRVVARHTQNLVGVALPYPYLYLAQKYLGKTNVLVGAQNVHFAGSGAYTGEVSLPMLSDFGTNFCIVGHSERRAYFNENNDDINKKVKVLNNSEITPVLCFGEVLAERESGKQEKVVKTQLDSALADLNAEEVASVVFAYEPVWAIGTGKSASNQQAQEMAKFVKDYLTKKYSLSRDQICFLYGGSMNEKNYAELLSEPDIDGGLVGGACLSVEKFSKIFSYNS